jgi:basic amino acid/polyamine antiporter, APA family
LFILSLHQLFRRKSINGILEHSEKESLQGSGLRRNLRLVDLTAFGIAAIIGAGIFSTIGNAAFFGGPAVTFLFVFTAVACGFSALCYAEFASAIPISGSAYTYAYVSFGELLAWIMGWVLILEYAVGNIAVAISWSEYFTGFLSGFSIIIPDYLSIDYLTAVKSHSTAANMITDGIPLTSLPEYLQKGFNAVETAPTIFHVPVICNIPAFCIVVLITALVYIGIQESKTASNIMVILKIAILILVISVGAFYVNPENWSPFAPNGFSGMFMGVGAVFFAYIGFDAISTTAEECKNPQRDLPKSMILALVITSLLYVLVALVLTGIIHYSELAVGDPLAFAFEKLGLTKFSGIIAFGAVIAMTGVLLVFQMGQPRIWMSMSRDGLLPKKFAKIHPRFRTPSFSTIIAGFLVGIPALFMNLTEVTDLTSIGALFAFALVCGGVVVIQQQKRKPGNTFPKSRFNIPYFSSRYILIVIWILAVSSLFAFTQNTELPSLLFYFPNMLFILVALVVSVLAVTFRWSVIPVMGLIINLYLMSRLDAPTWERFLLWLAIGLVLYFVYGYRKSRLKNNQGT